jgi:hypothetical protein
MTQTQDACASSTQEDKLLAAGERALAEAVRLWSLDVYDPKRSDKTPAGEHSRKIIQEIVNAAGWTWIDYDGDGRVEWCGLHAAACWRAAGIDPKWLATFWASTYRLDAWATYRDFNNHKNPKPAQGPYRLVAKLDSSSKVLPFEPRAGDILTVGDGIPAFGDHITIVESWDEARGIFIVLSGNGGGLGPDGKRRQGIVRSEFRLGGSGYCARRIIRPAPSDLL